MKKKILLFALVGSFMLSTTSCSNDDNSSPNIEEVQAPNTLKDDFFDIEGAKFKGGDLPAGERDVITEINVNKFVINGGKAIMNLTSTTPLESVLIALDGHDGYYSFKTSEEVQTRLGNYKYIVVFNFSQKLDLDSFGLNIVGTISDGEQTRIYYREFQTVTAGVGELQVSLSWDKEDDVDLHLFDADNNHIYYGDRVLHGAEGKIAELDIDSNPACSIDGVKNENIYYNDLKDGTYKVYVDLFTKCTQSEGSSYVVNVIHNGVSLRLSDHMIGKFADDYRGSGNTPSMYAFIGAFSIVDGHFSSVVESAGTARLANDIELKKELVYKK
ncbi:hypothetical protein [Myroides sp. N17-2]|uniref:hypothetical protein n=1 Tax=Myroides sp. N17-2 TaxID=2030799 RepID=UPI000EFC3881|nr:hypothetical protein [Myroides sp. N17-2]